MVISVVNIVVIGVVNIVVIGVVNIVVISVVLLFGWLAIVVVVVFSWIYYTSARLTELNLTRPKLNGLKTTFSFSQRLSCRYC